MFTPTIKLEHADARGEIYSISLPDNRELMLLHSKAGVFRGGHSHSCGEIVVVLTGRMCYYKILDGQEHQRVLQDGDSSFNDGHQIHMGEFLEDTWLIESKLARKGGWTQQDYEPFREKVRASQG